jgi:tRNA(fMet)-specific endonuclease VapC
VSVQYLLDTNTVSYALRDMGRVRRRMAEHTPRQLCMSAITEAELRFGAYKKKSQKLHAAIDLLLERIDVAPFTHRDASSYGIVISTLTLAGKSLSAFDGLIAAHAISLGLTLVTHDLAFRSVPNLAISDWY